MSRNKKDNGSSKSGFNIFKVVFFALLAVLLCVAGIMIRDYLIRKRAEDRFRDLQNQATVEAATEGSDPSEGPHKKIPSNILEVRGIAIPEMNLDWDALKAENEDIYSWIYIPNTLVNYPILQHPEERSFYLMHNLDGSYGYPGCIYTQNLNSKDWQDPNTVIFGHDMNDGSMFKTLHYFEDLDFYQKTRFIYIYTPEETYVYEIFAAYPYSDIDLLTCFDYYTPICFQSYLDNTRTINDMRAHYSYDVDLTYENHIITLSTCISYESESRWLIQAVLVNDPSLMVDPSELETETAPEAAETSPAA